MEIGLISLAISTTIRLFSTAPAQEALSAVGNAIETSGVLPSAIQDAYAGLKNLIKRKAPENRIARTIEKVEKAPQDDDRHQILADSVASSRLAGDQEVLAAAQKLLDLLKEQPGGPEMVAHVTQNVRGNNNTVIGVIKGDAQF